MWRIIEITFVHALYLHRINSFKIIFVQKVMKNSYFPFSLKYFLSLDVLV